MIYTLLLHSSKKDVADSIRDDCVLSFNEDIEIDCHKDIHYIFIKLLALSKDYPDSHNYIFLHVHDSRIESYEMRNGTLNHTGVSTEIDMVLANIERLSKENNYFKV